VDNTHFSNSTGSQGISRALLVQILGKIIGNPNCTTAWHELLHFGPVILAKPKRGGTKRNLSNVINNRVVAWNKGTLPAAPFPTTEYTHTRKSTEDSRIAAAVSSKLEAGNFRAAFRIVCSSDIPAQASQHTLEALQAKHPPAARDRRVPLDPGDNPRFEALQVSKEDIIRALRTFPLVSSSGPDGVTPQHLRDLLVGATDNSLHQALIDFVNLTLTGAFNAEVNSIFFFLGGD